MRLCVVHVSVCIRWATFCSLAETSRKERPSSADPGSQSVQLLPRAASRELQPHELRTSHHPNLIDFSDLVSFVNSNPSALVSRDRKETIQLRAAALAQARATYRRRGVTGTMRPAHSASPSVSSVAYAHHNRSNSVAMRSAMQRPGLV